MVWTCYTSNRTCKHHHAGHSTRREETRQTKEMLGRQHQGMDGAASRQDPEDKDGWRKIVRTSVVPLQLPPPPPLRGEEERPSNMLVYLRDGSALTVVRAATLRQKLQIKPAVPSGHIYTDTGPTSPSTGPITLGAS